MRQVAVLIIVAAIVGVIEAWDPAPQILQCWDEGQNGGDPGLVLKQGYILDLSSPRYSFDDKISYCCGVGTWILYEDAAYNIGDNADALETFVITSQVTGSQFCAEMPDTFDNRASSIRYLHSALNRAPSVILLEIAAARTFFVHIFVTDVLS